MARVNARSVFKNEKTQINRQEVRTNGNNNLIESLRKNKGMQKPRAAGARHVTPVTVARGEGELGGDLQLPPPPPKKSGK